MGTGLDGRCSGKNPAESVNLYTKSSRESLTAVGAGGRRQHVQVCTMEFRAGCKGSKSNEEAIAVVPLGGQMVQVLSKIESDHGMALGEGWGHEIGIEHCVYIGRSSGQRGRQPGQEGHQGVSWGLGKVHLEIFEVQVWRSRRKPEASLHCRLLTTVLSR